MNYFVVVSILILQFKIFFVSTFVGVSLADIPNTAYANLGGADIAAVISGMRTIIAKLCNSHQLLRQTLSISCYKKRRWMKRMTATLVKCACPSCSCEVTGSSAVVRNNQSFCSDACATGHPNNEPCHDSAGACGCTCGS